jgi:hypothetical protein
MLSAIRKHVNLATALALVALVFAATGGAFAATGGGSRSQATLTASIAKSKVKAKVGPRGPAGAKGVTGATGPAGAAGAIGATGAAGPAGAKGETGAVGSDGSDGTDGVSPEGMAFTGSKTVGSTTCTEGGIEYRGASVSLVCNGKKGANGTTGFTKTLPSEQTEMGSWAVGLTPPNDHEPVHASVSFSIPLASALQDDAVHYVKPGETPPVACTGGTPEAPVAEPGNLCIYAAQESYLTFNTIKKAGSATAEGGASTAGALVVFNGEEEGSASGTFAVTAEVE